MSSPLRLLRFHHEKRIERASCRHRSRKLHYSSTAPTCTPRRSRSASTSTTSGCCASSSRAVIWYAPSTTPLVIEDQEYSSIRPLIDWLDYNGYTVVTKATKEFVDQTGRRKVKGNMDIELAVDAMGIAPHIDQMVLFSGDGDFRSLVEAVQRRGVRVIVVSTISTQPPMVADELRRQADQFVDIVELQNKIGRDPAERPAREPRDPGGPRAAPHAAISPAQSGPAQRVEVEDEIRGRLGSDDAALRAGAASPGGIVRVVRVWSRFARPGESASRTGSTRRSICFATDRRTARDCWVCAGAPRRPPHRPALHRRLCRRSSLRNACRTSNSRRAAMRLVPDEDSFTLVDCRITNAVRCVPPENKPTPQEITTCRPFSCGDHCGNAAALLPSSRSGASPTTRVVAALGARRSSLTFVHGSARAGSTHVTLVRQLSLLALQHQHRRAHDGDVPRRRRAGCASTSPRCRPPPPTAPRSVPRNHSIPCGEDGCWAIRTTTPPNRVGCWPTRVSLPAARQSPRRRSCRAERPDKILCR